MRKAQYSTLLMALLVVVVAARAQSGFYRLGQINGRATLLNPGGIAVVLRAKNDLRLPGELSPADVDGRAQQIIGTLRRDSFNAIGPGSDAALWHRGLPYIEALALSGQLASEQGNSVVDVYAERFRQQVQELVAIAVRPRLQDHSLIGYMSDNGLRWAPNRKPEILLDSYLALPWTGADAGRQHVVDYLRERYGSNIAALRAAWHVKARDFTTLQPLAKPNGAVARDAAGFSVRVLARYLSIIAAAVHRDDPNHLFLGANLTFAVNAPMGSIWSIGDIASVELQPGQKPEAIAAALAKITRHPLLLELTACGSGASLPNVVGYLCRR